MKGVTKVQSHWVNFLVVQTAATNLATVARQGETCGVLGGVCRNSSAACAERRGLATAPLLCHCEVEKAPVKDSKLQRTQREKEFLGDPIRDLFIP